MSDKGDLRSLPLAWFLAFAVVCGGCATADLYRQADVPEYQCRFRWEKNSIAFWDNRAVQHYASSDFDPQRRVMERVTIIGDRPV